MGVLGDLAAEALGDAELVALGDLALVEPRGEAELLAAPLGDWAVPLLARGDADLGGPDFPVAGFPAVGDTFLAGAVLSAAAGAAAVLVAAAILLLPGGEVTAVAGLARLGDGILLESCGASFLVGDLLGGVIWEPLTAVAFCGGGDLTGGVAGSGAAGAGVAPIGSMGWAIPLRLRGGMTGGKPSPPSEGIKSSRSKASPPLRGGLGGPAGKAGAASAWA